MSKVHELTYKASFRGEPFLLVGSRRTGGRKTVSHEYPNTDRRYVEDLGRTVPVFSIDAVITGQEDYMLRRDAFIKVLEQQGPGQLSHPFYGDMKVACIDYDLTETMQKLGRAEFSIEFAITGEEIYPNKTLSGGSTVAIKVENIVSKVNDFGKLTYKGSLNNKHQHQFNVDLVNSVQSAMRLATQRILESTQSVEPDMSRVRSYIEKISTFRHKMAASPELFMNIIIGGMDEIDSIDGSQEYLYRGYKSMFDYRKEIKLSVVTTIQRLRNMENNNAITGVLNMLSLLYAYKQATGIKYRTTTDLKEVKVALEDQYRYILTIPNVDYDLLNDIREVRNDIREFFSGVGKQVFRVIPVRVSNIPLTVLAYQYYGSLSMESELKDLNNIVEPSFVDGEVRILAR